MRTVPGSWTGFTGLSSRQTTEVTYAVRDRPNLSLVHRRPESDRLPWGYRVPRAIELVFQARYISEVRHRDARSPEAVPR